MKNTLFILCLLFAVNSQAQVFQCKRGDTTVFSQTPCAFVAEVISGSRLRANDMEPVSIVNAATMPLPAANSNSESLQNQARMRYEIVGSPVEWILAH